MLPVKSVRLATGNLLAADVATLAPAAANKIALVLNAFTMDENHVLGDFTLATFTGSAPKAGAAGAQETGTDPATQDQIITNLAPVGGWRWECTVAPALPETVHGFILVNNAANAVLAMALLAIPVTIVNIGDFIDVGAVTFRFVPEPLA